MIRVRSRNLTNGHKDVLSIAVLANSDYMVPMPPLPVS